MTRLYPSLIACKFSNIQDCINFTESYSQGFHIDIMDNKFVSNSSWDPEAINTLREKTNKQFFIHLMVENPEIYLEQLKLNNSDIVSFHIETHTDHKNLIKKIHEKNLYASLAFKPKTHLELILNYIHDIDHILLMSVEPGFSGQEFLLTSFERFKALKSLKDLNQASFKIGLDGGVNKTNIKEINNLLIDDVAIGSAIFDSPNPTQAIKEIYNLIHEDKDLEKIKSL